MFHIQHTGRDNIFHYLYGSFFLIFSSVGFPPQCTKYPCLYSHHFLIAPLTACYYISPLLQPVPLSVPGCSVATSLWFQKHRVLLGYSWTPWPICPLLPWMPTNPRSFTFPPRHRHYINPSSLATAAPGARRLCVCVCMCLCVCVCVHYNIHTHRQYEW